MTQPARLSPAQVAVSMFTVIPVPVSASVDEDVATKAILWLPAVAC